ncbi:AAA family ATPase [Tepidibacillus marianensis]|uniref:AAA family ATPase n=1 Tax=Tepidibacillus marianensis TaxID=3131995 RepID=UPI0030D3B7FD
MEKNIKLIRLSLSNFKGIRNFTLTANGNNINIFGDNAVGKTTLFDAFTWLLFDKDSSNRKDFELKTISRAGDVLHNLEHEVEGILQVDGKQITLRKVFAEKWTKKRGSATSEFTGHTTDYFVDGVPVKLKEFKDRVDEIVNEDIFKLLTSPTFFNEQLKWQQRREILLQVCGDVSEDEVIASNKDLSELPAILNGRSIDNHKKVIAAKRAEINKELEKIPVRIDEAYRSMPDTNGLKQEELQREIVALKGQIEQKDAEAFRLRSGGQIVVKEKQLREIEGELIEIKNRLQADTLEKITAKRQEISRLKGEHSELQRKFNDLKWTIDRNDQKVKEYQDEAKKLRVQWFDINEEAYKERIDTNCPTCGQDLPAEQIHSAREKALANFNLSKSQRLEEVTTKGKSASSEAKRLIDESTNLVREMGFLDQQLKLKEEEIRTAETELNELQSNIADVETDVTYQAKKKKL